MTYFIGYSDRIDSPRAIILEHIIHTHTYARHRTITTLDTISAIYKEEEEDGGGGGGGGGRGANHRQKALSRIPLGKNNTSSICSGKPNPFISWGRPMYLDLDLGMPTTNQIYAFHGADQCTETWT